jgi:hypothetical protein
MHGASHRETLCIFMEAVASQVCYCLYMESIRAGSLNPAESIRTKAPRIREAP